MVAAPQEATAARPRPLLRGWLHLAAFAVVLVAGSLLILAGKTFGQRLCLTIYVASLALLFGVSAAFHRVQWGPTGRRRMRRLDHSSIFIAIAGTYTAVAGLVLTGWTRNLVLIIVWGGAAIGIVIRQVWLDAPKWVVALPYVVVGWSALVVVPQLLHGLGVAGFLLLLAGGVAYTAGAITYALKRPDPIPHVFGYHEVFHVCTVVGAALHFVVISAIALPAANR
ncbi:MAG: hemolysin III family protein [Acidimicrobiales bacterium]|nr:hemolysin III family protein [Acidimicrobiales bacterium]